MNTKKKKPRGLRFASEETRKRVASIGGKARAEAYRIKREQKEI